MLAAFVSVIIVFLMYYMYYTWNKVPVIKQKILSTFIRLHNTGSKLVKEKRELIYTLTG